MLLTETPGVAFSGEVTSGSHSPLKLQIGPPDSSADGPLAYVRGGDRGRSRAVHH
jgi:hypothetical protein